MALQGYRAAVDAIYAAAAQPGRWPAALEQTAEFAGGIGALLAYHDFAADAGMLVVGRLRDDLSACYVRDHIRNPYSLAAAARPQPLGPIVASSLVAGQVIRKTALHADILAPQRIVDLVILPHASLGGAHNVGGFAVPLGAGQAEQLPVAVGRLRRLAPHLSRALDLSREVARGQEDARRRGALIAALPDAALLLDRNGAILEANDAAERLLTEQDGLYAIAAAGLRLAASLPDDDRRLRALLAAAVASVAEEAAGYRQGMRIVRPSGAIPYVLLATPLPPAAFAIWGCVERDASLLIQVIDAERRAGAPVALLRAIFDLTPAEARVAALIGAGRSAPETAAVLGLTANTIRTHLGRCFDKTGARSQGALARLVAALAVDRRDALPE